MAQLNTQFLKISLLFSFTLLYSLAVFDFFKMDCKGSPSR